MIKKSNGQINLEEKDKILASFKSRLKTPILNYQSVQTELELMAKLSETPLSNLFILAETDQLSADFNDKAISLFRVSKLLKKKCSKSS